MSHFENSHIPHLPEYFVDICDVFTDEVDADGLQSLLTAFLDISHLSSGKVFMLNQMGQPDVSVSYSLRTGIWDKAIPSQPNHITLRSMNTLHTEFTVSGQSENIVLKYAFPLRVRGTALGAIELTDTSSHPLNETTVTALQNLADLSASVIDRTHCINQTRSLVGQLQTALNSRVIVEQAKGVLAERMQVDFPIAFQYLRNAARKEQVPLHQVAQRIIAEVPLNGQPMKVAN